MTVETSEEVEVQPGDVIRVAPAPDALTVGETVEVLVEARLAEEHAAEAVEGVEALEERVEECRTETELRLSALETQLASLTPEALAEQLAGMLTNSEAFRQQMRSGLHPEPSSQETPEEPAEILETMAESPETLEAASRETGLSETTISETLTEASSETRMEAPESAPADAPVLVAVPVPVRTVRFV